MDERFLRTEMLVGKDGVEKLKNSSVAIFGLGGVGGYIVEALARSGVGRLILVDNDVVSLSNINRQIIATRSSVGRLKTEVYAERIKDINPDVQLELYNVFYLPENADCIDFSSLTYVADAIDTVSGKIEIAVRAERFCVKAISCMGTGNKLDPTAFKVADIYKTSVCPLARVMRRELKARGVKALKVVYSEETPVTPSCEGEDKRVPASISFVPSVAGLIMAGEIIKDIIAEDKVKNEDQRI